MITSFAVPKAFYPFTVVGPGSMYRASAANGSQGGAGKIVCEVSEAPRVNHTSMFGAEQSKRVQIKSFDDVKLKTAASV